MPSTNEVSRHSARGMQRRMPCGQHRRGNRRARRIGQRRASQYVQQGAQAEVRAERRAEEAQEQNRSVILHNHASSLFSCFSSPHYTRPMSKHNDHVSQNKYVAASSIRFCSKFDRHCFGGSRDAVRGRVTLALMREMRVALERVCRRHQSCSDRRLSSANDHRSMAK